VGEDGVEILAAPLLVRGRLRGLFIAHSIESKRNFDREQVALCDGIARQFAVGIEAAELYQAQQEEAAIASSLARVGQELIVSLETTAILQRLSRLTTELLECYCSYTVLWQPTEEQSCQAVINCKGGQREPELLHSLRIPRSLITDLANRFGVKDVIDLNPAELSHFQFDGTPLLHDITAVLCLALRQGKELIGVQAVGYRQGRGVEAGKRRIACGIAQIASLALANARLLEELERANRLKQDFVGTMSHELRTPLNVILGYNELMRDGAFGELSSEQTDILERMNRSTTQLLDLINSTLDLSRMQSQNTPMSLTRVSVTELFAELDAEFRSLHKRVSVMLEWWVEPGLLPLQTDPVKLKMVLKNLVGNALKFTDEGVASTTASTQGEGIELSNSSFVIPGLASLPKRTLLFLSRFVRWMDRQLDNMVELDSDFILFVSSWSY
jgi:signal transduction histidine kinase